MAKKLLKNETKKKLRTFYKNNRIYCILIMISLACLLLLGIGVICYFIGQATSSSYGNRLDNIDQYKVDNELKELEAFYKSSEGVKSASVRLQGKIIYVDVEMDDAKTNEDIQNIATSSLVKLTDDQKSFYDIQFIFTRSKLHPYFGSKAHSNTIITWANYKIDNETTTTTTTKKKK